MKVEQTSYFHTNDNNVYKITTKGYYTKQHYRGLKWALLGEKINKNNYVSFFNLEMLRAQWGRNEFQRVSC